MGLGRPREFDVDVALDRALDVFWRRGYEGTSLTDLTDAMGVTRPSLYAAFGNKEELFRKVVERYDALRDGEVCEALTETSSRRAVAKFLGVLVDMADGDPEAPRGCLMVQGALVCSESGDPVRQELTARRAAAERKLRDRMVEWKESGDLPADSEPAALARYLMVIGNGIAVQAAGGASTEELRAVVDIAVQCWPAAVAH